jgi:type IV pilus assembly protein PilE
MNINNKSGDKPLNGKHLNYKHQGFTLIELMIVIAILGVISAIAIPAYNGYLTSARMLEAKNNIAALKLAEEEYYLEKNDYCYDDSDNNTNLSNACDNLWTASGSDGGTANFIYTVSGSGSSYSITATGKTGTKVAGKTESYP